MATLEEVYGEPIEVKPTDVFGTRPGTVVSKDSLAGVSLEDMGFTQQTEAETQADDGFFKRSAKAAWEFEKGSFEHPIQNLTGVVKGIAAGAVSMGELAAKGFAGLATAWTGNPGLSVGENYEVGAKAVDDWLDRDRKASQGIFLINLAPASKQEEAFVNLLNIIPDAVTATGDTVFEKTGSALAGASSQALLTLLTMKPSLAGKVLKGPLKLVKGEVATPGGKAGAEKVKAAFDELAVKDPAGATALAEHVIVADPELGMHLMKSIDDAGKRSPEEMGKEAAASEQPAPGTVRVYHGHDGGPITEARWFSTSADYARDWGTGNKQVSYVDVPEAMLERDLPNGIAGKSNIELPAELAKKAKVLEAVDPVDGIRKATAEFAEELAASGQTPAPTRIGEVARRVQLKEANEAAIREMKAQELADTRKRVYANHGIKALDDSDVYETSKGSSFKVTSNNGYTRAVRRGDALQIVYSDTTSKGQGKGEGAARIIKLAEIAEQQKKKLYSDTVVSASAAKVYDSLERLGYKITRNPFIKEADGTLKSDSGRPVFEVEKPKFKPFMPKGKKFVPSKLPEAPAYMDAGKPVTRKSVELAFRTISSASELPGIRLVTGKLTEYYRQLIHTVNPEALGHEAKIGASILAKHIAKQMQQDSFQTHRAAERIKFWNHQPPTAVIAFIKGFEKGIKFADPLLNKAAEAYRDWNKRIFEREAKLGFDYEPIDNYLFHIFEDSQKVAEFFTKRFGPKWNNPAFIKDRSFDLYAEAVKAGHKPKFTNPEDIMLARQHASNIAEMRVGVLEELKAAGLAKDVEAGGKGRPEAWSATEWRSPTGKRYWVHDSASAVLHNAFNTQSLWNLKGVGGDLFRSAMFLKNAIVPIKLALSLFHPLHVLTIDNATGMVRATKELLSGTQSPPRFVANMVKATVYSDVISNPRTGYRLLNVYKGKVPEARVTPADAQALQFMAEGGFIPEMSSQYRLGAIAKFKSSIQRRSATAAWHLPFAAIESLQRPMFEVWIPSLKIASYLKDVKTAIKTDPTLLDNSLKRQLAFRRLSKSVDNRYGEMAYNTLFWNRWVKDLAVANTLSLGWQMGFIREYGGGMLDLGQVVTKEGSIKQKVKSGNLDRPLFVTYYTTQALAYGGLLTWALTGQEPQDLQDYVYPRTGELLPNGRPERVNTMFYPREFAAIYKHMEHQGVVSGLGHLAASKASGVIGLTYEWATGINSFDQEIRDPDAPLYKQVEQTIAATLFDLENMHLGESIEPISLGTARESTSTNKTKSTTLSFLGFGPAPKYVTDTTTESLIKGTFRKYFSQRLTPFEKAQFSAERRELKKAFADGDGDAYSTILDRMREKFEMTMKEQRKLESSIAHDEDPLFDMYKRLTWQQQKKILDQMTPDERETFIPLSNKEHLRFSYEPPEERR